LKNKKLFSIIISIILLSSITLSLVIPATNAQATHRNKKTYAVCGLMPEKVGVGQETLMFIGITDYLMNPDEGWEGLTVIVTHPDGTKETLGPYRTDSTGATGDAYIPD